MPVRRSYDTNPEGNSESEYISSEREGNSYTEEKNAGPEANETPESPGYSAVEQPNEEQLQIGHTVGLPQSALSGGSRRGQIVRLPPGTRLVRLQRNDS